MMVRRFCAYLMLLIVSQQSVAALPKFTEKPIETAKHITIESTILSESLGLNVFLPESFEHVPSQTYPVIFANGAHGEVFFHALTGVTKHLGQLDRMPEAIVVSLNHSGHYPTILTNGMWAPDRKTIEGYGKPELYKQFLKQELFPFLKEHYRASDYRFLIGVSGSALFPLTIMQQEPDLFDGYILMASHDVIGMGINESEIFLDSISTFLKQPRKRPGGLFFAVADVDTTRREDHKKNVETLQAMIDKTSNPNTFAKVDIIENERHYDIYIKAMLAAYEMWFPETRWAPRYRDLIAKPGNALENIESFYDTLGQEYGIELIPKPNRWNSVNGLRVIGRILHRDNRHDEALEVAERRLHYTPNDPGALMQIAEAYEQLSQIPNAFKHQKQAVQMARAQNDEYLDWFEDYLKRLEETVNLARD